VSAGNSSKVADEIVALDRIEKNANGPNLVGKAENSIFYEQAEKYLQQNHGKAQLLVI